MTATVLSVRKGTSFGPVEEGSEAPASHTRESVVPVARSQIVPSHPFLTTWLTGFFSSCPGTSHYVFSLSLAFFFLGAPPKRNSNFVASALGGYSSSRFLSLFTLGSIPTTLFA